MKSFITSANIFLCKQFRNPLYHLSHLQFPEFFMVCGLILFTATMLAAGHTMYGDIFIIICGPGFAVGGFTFAVVWLIIVLTLDREGGLWEVSRESQSQMKELSGTEISNIIHE